MTARRKDATTAVMIDAPLKTPDAIDVASYAYKASLAGAGWSFELGETGIKWQAGRRSGYLPYDEIVAITMSYRPVSMQANRFRTDIVSSKGLRLPVLSVTWKSMALVETQSASYRAFVMALHRRLLGSRGIMFRAGLRPFVFAIAGVALTLVAVAMAILFVRALLTGSWSGALFMIGFAALFGWQIGGFMMRNRPALYSPDQPPVRLLPR